jgi:hypothetical protein
MDYTTLLTVTNNILFLEYSGQALEVKQALKWHKPVLKRTFIIFGPFVNRFWRRYVSTILCFLEYVPPMCTCVCSGSQLLSQLSWIHRLAMIR